MTMLNSVSVVILLVGICSDFYAQVAAHRKVREAFGGCKITNNSNWIQEVSSPSTTPKDWREEALKAHNHFRELHDAPPLKLNMDLCEVSQKWVDVLLQTGLKYFNDNLRMPPQIEKNHFAIDDCKLGESSIVYLKQVDDKLSAEAIKQY